MTVRTFNDWRYEQPEEVEERLDASKATINDMRSAFQAGFDAGMAVVPPPNNANLKLSKFSDTTVKVYGERDDLRKQCQELTYELRQAHKINGKMHKLLDAARELIEVAE